MTEITLTMNLKNCLKCPFVTSEVCYTADSWEHASDYFCLKSDRKKIAGYIEWESEMPGVPDWCPLRKGNNDET